MTIDVSPPEVLITPADHALDQGAYFILAHGAGAAMDSPFMNTIAEGVAARGVTVVRFEFPYMAGRRIGGSKRPPDRQPVLLACWKAVIEHVRAHFKPAALVIGGKSMGGRMASLVADRLAVSGVVGLGFPFHPAGKPEKAAGRVGHLATLETPALFCQGTRDAFGSPETIQNLSLSSTIIMQWLEDGDHSLKPRKLSGRSEGQALAEVVEGVSRFIAHRLKDVAG